MLAAMVCTLLHQHKLCMQWKCRHKQIFLYGIKEFLMCEYALARDIANIDRLMRRPIVVGYWLTKPHGGDRCHKAIHVDDRVGFHFSGLFVAKAIKEELGFIRSLTHLGPFGFHPIRARMSEGDFVSIPTM